MLEVTPELVVVLVALVVLLASATLTNILFGHSTFFRSSSSSSSSSSSKGGHEPRKRVFSSKGGHENRERAFNPYFDIPPLCFEPSSPDPHIVPQGPARAYSLPLSTPDRLQALLPQELVTSEVLTFLSPYDVTRALPTCQFLNTAGEQPAYWNVASRNSSAAWVGPPDITSMAEEGEEEQNGWDLSACESPKLEFFRRVFVFPYQICECHITRTSCRVVIKSRVYDVTPFLSTHPGGDSTLLDHAGPTDATGFFEVSNHSATAKQMMKEYLLWDPSRCQGRAGTILGLYYADPPPQCSTDSPVSPLPSSFAGLPLVQTACQMLTGQESWSKRVRLQDDRRVIYMREFVGDKRPPDIVRILRDKRF